MRKVNPKNLLERNWTCPIFGSPRDLKQNVLPTYKDVMLCCFQERKTFELAVNQVPPFKVIAKAVSLKIAKIYGKTSIPILSHRRIVAMINDFNSKYWKIRRVLKRIGESEKVKKDLEKFKEDSSELFDIATCKCKSFQLCKCKKDKKIPICERQFLSDQRSSRELALGPIDQAETERINKSLNRKKKDSTRCSKKIKTEEPTYIELESSEEIAKFTDSEELFQPSSSNTIPSSSRNDIDFKKTALLSMRYNVSERAAAAITTGVMQDLGLVSESDKTLVSDRYKMRRARLSVSKDLKLEKDLDVSNEKNIGIYFDGRHDDTLLKEKKGNKMFGHTVKEDHYSLIHEPGSSYIGHVSPISGKAVDISECIFKFLKEEISNNIDNISAVGCDGTVVNTGHKGGTIRLLELKFKRPLQWFICLLHFNELPLRALFESIDGPTSGPKSFSGPLGKMLKDCENLTVTNFEPIICNLPEIDPKILSKDQKYLYEICQAVNSGVCPEDLKNRLPGPLNHARWLTAANRLLRLYVTFEKPDDNLKGLVNFICKVYAPSWFEIKIKHSVKDGARHLYNYIRLTRDLPEDYIKIIDPVIARNAYFAHPENILLSMLTDEDAEIRKLAVQRILESRQEIGYYTENTVRKFKVPPINFEAENYTEMIDWTAIEISPPPVFDYFEETELQEMLDANEIPFLWEFTNFPCHTQAVERLVKLVTQASSKVFGFENRDALIRSTLHSRSEMPVFESKKDFHV